LDEICDYGALDRGEIPVPDEIDGDGAFKKRAIVVIEHKWLLLIKCG
jgi:hypothetical protein